MNRYRQYILILAGLFLLSACQKDDDATNRGGAAEKLISFNGSIGEQATRATAYPLYYYQTDIKLIGTKTVNGTTSFVFPNYRLQYIEGTQTWEYEEGLHTSLTGQIAKYWDTEATQYSFVAGAPYSATTIDNATKQFKLVGLQSESVTSGSSTITTAYLYSFPKVVTSSEINDDNFSGKVMLTFQLALCRIKVAFVFDELQTEDVTLTDITFGPSETNKYITEGNIILKDNGDHTTFTCETEATKESTIDLAFEPITIAAASSTTKTYAENIYYMLPQTNTDWTLTIGSLTTANTATVPAADMKWEPNHEYTYVFKLANAVVDPTIKYIQCLTTAMTTWDVGTDMSQNVYNW